MDIETSVDTKQEQLPQVRRVSRLDEIPKILPTRPIPLSSKKTTPVISTQKPKSLLRYYLIGMIIFGIIGLELAIIYRYDTLNKRLYNISVSLKDKLDTLQHKFRLINKLNMKLAVSRRGIIDNYMKLGSRYKIFQYKADNYKEISRLLSMAKSSKIDVLEGDLSVANARIGAVDVQNELLAKKLKERDGSINELASKLFASISEQKTLVNENLRLMGEYERLSNELQTIKTNTNANSSEENNVNK